METNDNNFSLLRLLAEANLNEKNKKQPISDKTKIPSVKANKLINSFTDIFNGQTIELDNIVYEIMGVTSEKNSLLFWLWSDSDESERTIQITMRIDDIKVDPTYWEEDNG